MRIKTHSPQRNEEHIMRKSTKLVGTLAFAVAGLTAVGGAALTGTGVATSGSAASAQFVGGTVSQAVTGATLTAVTYGYNDATDTMVSTIALTFATTADGHAVTVAPSGGGAGVGTFTCGNTLSNASSCTYAAGSDTFTGYTGLTSLATTVS
jgi:L-serine deaminase